jgi:hypothetical protein
VFLIAHTILNFKGEEMRLKQMVDKINNVKPVRRHMALAKKF